MRNELNAIKNNYKFYVEKSKFGWALFLQCSDSCGNSYSGQFDYHWTYASRDEAIQAGFNLSLD